MADDNTIWKIFLKTIEHITGLHKHRPLGGIAVRADGKSTIQDTVADSSNISCMRKGTMDQPIVSSS